ncbi:hypothetical protein BDP27DRAFT_1330835 [Rhodocollybia butyracea]|uniref:Uncharacterized protein n=1 Tax=Rhodocollybia butyracea TaxID=206335 RepID=A0A9P5PNF8_9AGAR|nr:hypothetical protein BDP27DRAFT_1330835 [Rhodocollybia butyracea]
MLYRFFALFFLFTSFGAGIAVSVPSATSVEIAKRQAPSALDIFNTLKNSTDTILPQITTLVQGKNASSANVTPLISSLRTALQTATSSLSSTAPPSDDAAATLGVQIFTDIANTLSTLPGEIIPDLAGLLGDLDDGLAQAIDVIQVLNPIITPILQGVTAALNFVNSILGLIP